MLFCRFEYHAGILCGHSLIETRHDGFTGSATVHECSVSAIRYAQASAAGGKEGSYPPGLRKNRLLFEKAFIKGRPI